MAKPRAPLSYDAFAIAAPGLEPLVATELRALGAKGSRVVAGGVEFKSDRLLLARANIKLRVASRVLVRLARFRAEVYGALVPGGATPEARRERDARLRAVARRYGLPTEGIGVDSSR